MPIIGVLLKPGNTGANVRELHKQLLSIGAVIAQGERDAANYGPSTVAAVRAFQSQKGLLNGDAFTVSTGRLLHVASAFDLGGPEALRSALLEVVPVADAGQPQELYQLARYAILARDYQMAQSIAERIPDHPDVRSVVGPILALADKKSRPPELPYPENFYTYRYDLIPRGLLQELLQSEGTPPGIQARRRVRGADGENDFPPDLPDPPDPPPDPDDPAPTVDELRRAAVVEGARSWLDAADFWRQGNEHFKHRRYAKAAGAYEASQRAALRYFEKYYGLVLGNVLLLGPLTTLVSQLFRRSSEWPNLWESIRRRRLMLSLNELHSFDWKAFSSSAENLLRRYLGGDTDTERQKSTRERQLDLPMLILAAVFVPLARAEANRARRQYSAANSDLTRVAKPFGIGLPVFGNPFQSVSLACDFIERPFAQVLRAETLLDQADAEYKALTPAAEPPAPDVTQFQNLKAAQTYLDIKAVFKNEGSYISMVETAATKLTAAIEERLAAKDTISAQFELLGKDILIPNIVSASDTLPGLDRRAKAHEPLLQFKPSDGETVMRETNPRVFAALLTATARLEQLKAGFNYLGYRDSYVPPWRFQFLLDRARYFTEHAKNAQRDYLNFLSNAEREEFQELSTSQNVEMEKSNIRIETARVTQVQIEVKAASLSHDLALIHAINARESFVAYQHFDAYADQIMNTKGASELMATTIALSSAIPVAGSIVEGVADYLTGGFFSSSKRKLVEAAQREIDKKNLERSIEEANRAAGIALTQLDSAQAGLAVAGLQRQAALLRHEFALQNLEFLRNRVLNTEQWYRLGVAIRSVAETYLRYSVELAFLAEQAYEFEADKRINVIRFDYDLSEVGDFLAADFLLKDLDTLEQDLIVTQKQRQQEVRYVLSMAREFPEALQEIRDNGKTTFSLHLEQLEKRFPGLYNLRIGAVDVLPIALMDSTRFSMELTHLGTSQVRLKAQPDTPPGTPSDSPLNTNDLPIPTGEWLAELQETWPIKLRVTGPETVVFSGLSRQDASAVFAFATTSQRHAFESLGAAAAWEVDFTARDNQVVPGTLADLLITLTLSGYHDPELRKEIDLAPRTANAATRFLSGQTTFPDALYEFNRSGRMAWNVTRDLLTLTETLGAVRNIAVLLMPTPGRANYFCNVMSHCQVQVRITSSGDLQVLSEIPEVSFTLGGAANPLSLSAQATLAPGATISWDFGDGSARQSGSDQLHTYSKPGRFTVSLRVVRNGRLSEFQGDVVVSRSHAEGLKPPVTAFPTLTRDETSTDVPAGLTRVVGETDFATDDPVIANWRVGTEGGFKGNRATFDLKPGDHTLFFSAVRPLKARAYSSQRHVTEPVFDFSGLSLSSNRRFDLDGTEITGVAPNPQPNLVVNHLFGNGALSPVDEWTIEFPLSHNGFLRSVSATDIEEYDLAQIQDVVLALEYEATPASS